MISTLRHRPGEKIQERYEVLEELGSGAFGTVYKCRDLELDVYVAVKELHVLDDPQTAVDERAAALLQFRGEALHLSNLRHPHIVSGHYQPHNGTWLVCPICGFAFRGVRECLEHNAPLVPVKQRHYLVMEYLDGPDLGEAAGMAGNILALPLALRWARQVGEALALIHSKGWIHRDVKPENIKLRLHGSDLKDAEAVLLDFGIASESGALGDYATRTQRHTQGGGTLGYAPESLQERRHPDERSDIHALGMTLYRLLSGRDPGEPGDLVALRQFSPRAFNPRISPALEGVILRSIAPDAKQRPANAREWLRALDAAEGNAASIANGMLNRGGTLEVVPLGFSSGRNAATPEEAVALLDSHPADARRLLYSGQLAQWFDEAGRPAWAQRAREIQREFPDYREQGVEALLQFTGLVAVPRVEAYPSFVEFGALRRGEKKEVELRLHNAGRGWLFGTLRSEHPGARVAHSFEGNDARVTITLDSRRLGRGEARGDIVVDSSAGELRVPVRATVRSQDFATTITVVMWAALGMLCGQLLRTVSTAHLMSPPGYKWLPADFVLKWYPAAPLFGVLTWGILVLLSVGESTRQKSCGTLFLGLSVAIVGGVLAGSMGNTLLVAGDTLLRPVMEPLTHHWAAGGWMFGGGIVGALYGTLRRLRDLFTPRGGQIAAGWIFALAMWVGVLYCAFLVVPAFY